MEVGYMKRFLSTLAVAGALVVGAAAPGWAAPSPSGSANATGYDLALGDSLAAGYQPGQGDDKTGGYVGAVEAAITQQTPKTRLVNLACSGETTTTMLDGGVCSYDEGSQFDQALAFLHAHGRFTRVVTIDIGANDVQRCVSRTTGAIDFPCVQSGLTAVATNLPTMLGKIRSEAPNATVVVLNYYNPFLAAYLRGPDGQALAAASQQLAARLNGIIAGAAAANGARLADIASAFRTTDTTLAPFPGFGTLPTNVGTICTLTWMCLKTDIHANDAGYALMGRTVVARLP
jgi:lysophospholipase L1-like esterase